jgi:hypothetical protein
MKIRISGSKSLRVLLWVRQQFASSILRIISVRESELVSDGLEQ